MFLVSFQCMPPFRVILQLGQVYPCFLNASVKALYMLPLPTQFTLYVSRFCFVSAYVAHIFSFCFPRAMDADVNFCDFDYHATEGFQKIKNVVDGCS